MSPYLHIIKYIYKQLGSNPSISELYQYDELLQKVQNESNRKDIQRKATALQVRVINLIDEKKALESPKISPEQAFVLIYNALDNNNIKKINGYTIQQLFVVVKGGIKYEQFRSLRAFIQ